MTREELAALVRERFDKSPERHEGIDFDRVRKAILTGGKTDVLIRMEESGGEVDAVRQDADSILFFDCAAESPAARRSVCYDRKARLMRKAHAPHSSMEELAEEIGAEPLDEEDYLFLQSIRDVDLKSQSWIRTEDAFRSEGDALFGTKRHGRTFIYFNGVQSYYSIRGFRCKVRLQG